MVDTRTFVTGAEIWMAGPVGCQVPTAATTPKEAAQRYIMRYYGPTIRMVNLQTYQAEDGSLEGQAVVRTHGRTDIIYANKAVLI